MVIDFKGDKPSASIPIEDIAVLVLDSLQITLSQAVLSVLIQENVALIVCDDRHMPIGLMMNLDGNSVQREKFSSQVNASEPLKKRLWKQTIQAKIHNQSVVLNKLNHQVRKMSYWISKVRSGDPDNYESRAAVYYWAKIFSEHVIGFKRGRYESKPNHMLNYGYAILRAIVARSLVASGCLPTLGIHHRNKYNAYCLADDIMEPYRPYVDQLILDMIDSGLINEELTTEMKRELLKIPTIDVFIGNKQSPLMVAVQRTTASLSACYEGKQRKVLYPVMR